jgi:type I restriction enzyme S subunit
MKAAELRKSILQAAVQGRLVPQDLHDEPASVLLERIHAEKARLVKEGKIKKEKPLSPIAEDEIPYDLPEGWVWCRLGDIAVLYNGRAYKKHELLESGSVPVLRVGNLFTNSKWYYSNLKLPDYKYCDNGDLLYAWSASFGPHIWNGGKVIYHYHIWKVFLPNSQIRDYMYYTLLEQTQEIKNSGHGLAMVHVTKENTENGLFPLPPLAEQQRIVAKVNELMALCDELEEAEQELDALESRFEEYLPKSILQAAVQGKLVPQDIHDEPASVLLERIRAEKARLVKEGKIKKEKPLPPISEDEIPYDLPEGWVWCRLGDIAILNPRNYLDGNTKVSFVPMALISNEYFKGHNHEIREWGDVKNNFTHFAENDVALAKITPCFENGKSCIMTNLCNGYGAGTTELHIIRCIVIMPQYMLIYLKTPEFISAGKMNMTGTAGQQRVPAEYLKKCLFPLPPLAEQQRIVAKVNELMALCEEIKAVKTKPIEQRDTNKVIDFPAIKQDEQIQLAARGEISKKSSTELMQAIDDMFAGDE